MGLKSISLCLPFLLMSGIALGATYYTQPVTGEVKSLVVNSPFVSNRNIVLELTAGTGALSLCGGNATSGYINKSDNPDTYNVMLSTLLSAKATKSEVVVATADGIEGCRIDQVEIK